VHRIELAPNCSLSAPTAVLAFVSLAGASLFVALVIASRGFWPVLPFAGLELALLGWALWLARTRSCHRREYVLLDDEHVVVEKHRRGGCERVAFPRYWARVRLEHARLRHHPSRLLIGASGRDCEIGDFLTESERRSLERRLAELLAAPAPQRKLHTL